MAGLQYFPKKAPKYLFFSKSRKFYPTHKPQFWWSLPLNWCTTWKEMALCAPPPPPFQNFHISCLYFRVRTNKKSGIFAAKQPNMRTQGIPSFAFSALLHPGPILWKIYTVGKIYRQSSITFKANYFIL